VITGTVITGTVITGTGSAALAETGRE